MYNRRNLNMAEMSENSEPPKDILVTEKIRISIGVFPTSKMETRHETTYFQHSQVFFEIAF